MRLCTTTSLTRRGCFDMVPGKNEENEAKTSGKEEGTQKRVVIYARVSTKDQEKEKTINTQVDLLTPIIHKQNYDLVEIVKDEDVSGDTDPEKRPGLSRIMKMAENDAIEEVWVASRDRLARNVDLMGFIRVTLRRKGVKVLALDDSEEKFVDQVKDMLSEMELDKYRKKRLDGINRAIREGRTLHRPPFGYESVDKKLEVDEEKRGIIKGLFEDFNDPLMSLKKLADKYGLTRSMIQRIRSNPIYTTGEVRWQGKVIYHVEPIVPMEKEEENGDSDE